MGKLFASLFGTRASTTNVVWVQDVFYRGDAWRIRYSATGDGQNSQESRISQESKLPPFDKLGRSSARDEQPLGAAMQYIGLQVQIDLDRAGNCNVNDLHIDDSPLTGSAVPPSGPTRRMTFEERQAFDAAPQISVIRNIEVSLNNVINPQAPQVQIEITLERSRMRLDLEGSTLTCLNGTWTMENVDLLRRLLVGKHVKFTSDRNSRNPKCQLISWASRREHENYKRF